MKELVINILKNIVNKYRLFGFKNVHPSCHHGSNIKVYGKDNLYMGERCNLSRDAVIMCTNAKFIMKKDSGAAVGLFVATGNHMSVVGMSKVDVTDDVKKKLDPNKLYDRDVIVEEEVWIGAHSILLSGVHLGRGCIVGAGSVVRNDVPPYSVVEGNPAKVVSYRFKLNEIKKHEEILYEEKDRLPFDHIEQQFNNFYGKSVGLKQLKGDTKFTIKDYNNLFIKVFNCSLQSIEELEYKNSKGWDSVGHMSLIISIEQTFGINLLPEDFLKFSSYQKGIDVLKNYGIDLSKGVTKGFPKELFDFSTFSENVAVITPQKSYTYKELDNKVFELKSLFTQGRLAFILARNTIGSIVSYVSCVKNYVPVALIDANKDFASVSKLIDLYKPQYLMLPKENVTIFGGELICDIYDYSLIELESTQYAINTDLSVLLTTSGSTGSPKFVRLSRNNLKANAESIANYLELDANERPITSLPMYYSYGLSVINSHFIVGATILLTPDSVVSPYFWEFAKNNKATSISGVPYTYDLLEKTIAWDLPYLTTFTQAGGKMIPETVLRIAKKCQDSGKRLYVMYGQTEATARISYLPFDKAIKHPDSIGIAIPDGKMSIADDGELIFEGENVSLGYAESYLDLSKPDENFGVLNTGDMARMDSNGLYYITGRKKRFVKVYGNRISLDELEKLVSEKFGKVACTGTDDNVIIYTDKKDVKLSDIESYIVERTKINHSAFKVCYIKAFPYSSSGKLLYTNLEIQR